MDTSQFPSRILLQLPSHYKHRMTGLLSAQGIRRKRIAMFDDGGSRPEPNLISTRSTRICKVSLVISSFFEAQHSHPPTLLVHDSAVAFETLKHGNANVSREIVQYRLNGITNQHRSTMQTCFPSPLLGPPKISLLLELTPPSKFSQTLLVLLLFPTVIPFSCTLPNYLRRPV